MGNPNRQYFRHLYPKRWLENTETRTGNLDHYRYQQITLESLECFDGCTLLECGCGSGELLDRLLKLYPSIEAFGVDLGRESMLNATDDLLSRDRVHFIEGDIGTLPFGSDRFDRVLCSSVLWYVPNPVHAIQEMIRVLKPGGRFVFDVRSPYHIENIFAKLTLNVRRHLGRLTPSYSFVSIRSLTEMLRALPVDFALVGYFVLLPTRLPLLGQRWGNWARLSSWLSFKAGHVRGVKWAAKKILVAGSKHESNGQAFVKV